MTCAPACKRVCGASLNVTHADRSGCPLVALALFQLIRTSSSNSAVLHIMVVIGFLCMRKHPAVAPVTETNCLQSRWRCGRPLYLVSVPNPHGLTKVTNLPLESNTFFGQGPFWNHERLRPETPGTLKPAPPDLIAFGPRSLIKPNRFI